MSKHTKRRKKQVKKTKKFKKDKRVTKSKKVRGKAGMFCCDSTGSNRPPSRTSKGKEADRQQSKKHAARNERRDKGEIKLAKNQVVKNRETWDRKVEKSRQSTQSRQTPRSRGFFETLFGR